MRGVHTPRAGVRAGAMLKWTQQRAGQRRAAPGHPADPAGTAPARPAEAEPAESLSQLLLREGKATPAQMEAALARQRETGAFLGEILTEDRVIDEQSLIAFLAKYCKVPHLSLLDYLIDPEILALVPADVCLRHRCVPIDRLGQNLTLAMVNPLDRSALAAVRDACPDLRIKPILCAFRHFEAVTAKLFQRDTRPAASLSATSLGLSVKPRRPVPETPPPGAAPTAEAPTAPEPAPEQPPPPPPLPEGPPPPDLPVGLPEDEGTQRRDALINEVFAGGRSDGREGSVLHEVANVMADSMRDTYAVLARRMELFRGVDPEDVARIFARGITSEYPAAHVVFRAGDPGDRLYVILGGAVLIEDDGRELARLGRGDMFGEMALADAAPRSATARVMEDASLLALSWQVIHYVLPPEVACKLLVNILITLSGRLREANRLQPGK